MGSPGRAKSTERTNMQPGATSPADLGAGEVDGDRKSPGHRRRRCPFAPERSMTMAGQPLPLGPAPKSDRH
jgi:hypothetical protein